MTPENRRRYEYALKQLRRLAELNAPAMMVGHAALRLAAYALCERPGKLELARYLIGQQRENVAFSKALLDPNSPESIEYAELAKAIDDVEIEEMCLGVDPAQH